MLILWGLPIFRGERGVTRKKYLGRIVKKGGGLGQFAGSKGKNREKGIFQKERLMSRCTL